MAGFFPSGLPDSFPAFLSLSILVGAVVGGLATIWGALIGAAFIQFVPNFADQISKSAPAAVYGICLIGLMYLAPTGVMGILKKSWSRLGGRLRSRNPPG